MHLRPRYFPTVKASFPYIQQKSAFRGNRQGHGELGKGIAFLRGK